MAEGDQDKVIKTKPFTKTVISRQRQLVDNLKAVNKALDQILDPVVLGQWHNPKVKARLLRDLNLPMRQIFKILDFKKPS